MTDNNSSLARQILINAIQSEEDPESRHWGELVVIEIENIDKKILTLQTTVNEIKKSMDDIKDAMKDKDHNHDLSIKELEIRLAYISLGGGGFGGGVAALLSQLVINWLQVGSPS